MRTKICYLIVSCMCIMGVADGYGNQRKYDDITLDQLIDNGKYDLSYRTHFTNAECFQDSIINEIEGTQIFRYVKQESWLNDCLYAFTKWCDAFLQEKRDYTVFQLNSFTDYINRINEYKLFSTDEKKPAAAFSKIYRNKYSLYAYAEGGATLIKKDGTKITPYAYEYPINQMLKDNRVIVLSLYSGTLCKNIYPFYFMAIIPYKNKLYRYCGQYQYEYNFDYENLRTEDTYIISKEIGNFILKYPYLFLSSEGDVNGTSISRYFKWTYIGSVYCSIEEIPLNVEDGPITIRDIMTLPYKSER